ncbi:MAG TPA: GrpB family protein [Thermomicrobiales bacterium]|nr:GrpB family protein [Thermomicrobiales bacterium]
MQRAIEIVPYDEQWPDAFRVLGAALRNALNDTAVRIDHIGSTSVPGLAAKDIIDIQVTVRELDAPTIAGLLAPLGYSLREDITRDHVPPGGSEDPAEWRKLYFRAPDHLRPMHLHVRQENRANQRYPLLFRDYLRATPAASEAYRQIKVALTRLHPNDQDAYYDVKDPVCDLIIDAAERWARETGYTLGPSDA